MSRCDGTDSGAALQLIWPAHHEGIGAAFGSTSSRDRLVDVGHANIVAPPLSLVKIIGVFFNSVIFQCLYDTTDTAVDGAYRTGIDAGAVIGEASPTTSKSCRVACECVNAPMRQIEEKRLVFIGGNRFHRLVGEIIGQIAVGFKAIAIVKTDGVAHYLPLYLIKTANSLRAFATSELSTGR